MKIEESSDTVLVVRLPNGNNLVLMYSPSADELTIAFGGEGHRNIKEVQHRQDGYSSCTFTPQK